MKTRICLLLSAASVAVLVWLPAAAMAQAAPTHKKAATKHMAGVTWSSQQGEWADVKAFPAGAQMKVMNGNPKTGASDVLLKLPGAYAVPSHWHTATETVYVQAGTMEFKSQHSAATTTVSAPAFFQVPARMVHRGTCTSKEDCYLFVHSSGPLTIHLASDQGGK